MPATILGTTGAQWALSGAEAGLITQSFGRKTARKTKAIANEGGETALVSKYDPTAKYTVVGYTKAATGVAAAAPGVGLTLAGPQTGNGVTAGSIYCDDTNLEQANEDFQKFTVTADQWPLIST